MATNAKRRLISTVFGIGFSGDISVSIHECFKFFRYTLFHRFL